MSILRMTWIASGLAALASGTLRAETLDVPTAFATVNDALEAASPGDTVLVAAGVYSDSETRQISLGGSSLFTVTSSAFLKEGVSLVSASGPSNTVLELDPGQLAGRNWTAVGVSLSNSPTSIDGFTIRGVSGGSTGLWLRHCADFTVVNCVFENLAAVTPDSGGGIEAALSSVELRDSVFRSCSGFLAGGSAFGGCDVRMVGCTFQFCESEQGGGAGYTTDNVDVESSAWIEDCTFDRNSSLDLGGALLLAKTPEKTVVGCRFYGNRSATGGAIAITGTNRQASLRDIVFIGNSSFGVWGDGGAVRVSSHHVTIEGCLFYACGQEDEDRAGGAAISARTGVGIEIRNNVFSNCFGYAAVDALSGSAVLAECNVFWDNSAGNLGSGVFWQPSNQAADPRFCNASAGDFTVEWGSPCLPEWSMDCGLVGPFGQGCGTVSVESESWGGIKSRYRTETRN